MKEFQINNEWNYIPDFKEEYLEDFPESQIVDIPHTNIQTPFNNFDEKIYQFISSYKKIFSINKKTNKRYFLIFDGVMNYSKVYLNKTYLGEHKGGYTPFSFEVTDYLQEENTLFVMVDSTERNDIPPHGFVVDYLTYGGIYREVRIIEVESSFIKNVFIDTYQKSISIRLENIVEEEIKRNIRVVIKDELDKVIKEDSYQVIFQENLKLKTDVLLELWSLDNPKLYKLEIYLDKILQKEIKFARRKIEFKKDGFYLNDEKIKLIGLNRHQSYPYVGYAMPSNAQRKDADILKYELGCNVVRSSHYPPSKHFLDRCDEIGLLVVTEIPGWQHIGDKSWQEVAIKNVEEMIVRDYNHPSIILWGVRINESKDNHEFYLKTNELARLLDKTRPTGGVRNFKNSDFLEDVYTYNDFVHRGDNIGLEKRLNVTKKDVPYLVTEYNGHMYPTKKFDDEIHRINHTLRHLNVMNYAYKYKDIAGAIGWCMFDYNTHKDFGSGDKICYHGVLDMFRIPKYAASAYAANGLKEPYMDVLSNLNIGEYEASEIKKVYVNTNVDYIKFYTNDEYINTFYRDGIAYKYLPNAPIIIDDFIGTLIEKNEPFSKKDAKIIKDVLLAVVRYGSRLPLKYKLKMGYFLLKNHMTIDEAAKFYEKYIGKWGLESLTYKFEGYLDDKLVITKYKGVSKSNDLKVFVDDLVLQETNTYETTRIIVKHQDEYQNDLTYSFEPIEIEIEGPIELIGPNKISLVGGSTGFYVRTIHQKGKAKILIKSKNFTTKEITIEVK